MYMSIEQLNNPPKDPGFAVALTERALEETINNGVVRIIPSLTALHGLMRTTGLVPPEGPCTIQVRAATKADRDKRPRLVTDVVNTPFNLQGVRADNLPLFEGEPTMTVTIPTEWDDPRKILGGFARTLLTHPDVNPAVAARIASTKEGVFKGMLSAATLNPVAFVAGGSRWLTEIIGSEIHDVKDALAIKKVAESKASLPLTPEFDPFDYKKGQPRELRSS